MNSLPNLILIIFILSIVHSIEIIELENIENPNNLIYPVGIGQDVEERQFLIDLTKQETYLFRNDKITINEEDDEFETNLEINTLHLKEFEFELCEIPPESRGNPDYNIDGIIGLGTVNGKNSFMGQFRNNRIIKSRKVYLNLENDNSKKLKFQYEVPKNYENDFNYCPLISYKSSYDKKYHESWMCEMTHILIKNEENEEDKNKVIYLNDTYETMGKIIFNPNSNYITAPEIYLHYLKIQFSMNSKNRCSIYKKDDKIYLYCNYENEKNLEKLPYMGILIEGYLHKIPVQNLFNRVEDGSYMCLIRFDKKNNKGHLWEFGMPLFQSFVIELDFDNKRVGLGEPKLKSENLTEEWIQWYSLNEGLSPRLFASKMTMIIGIVCILIIILFILGCALFSYFKNYYVRRNSLQEEQIGKNIEMVNKK